LGCTGLINRFSKTPQRGDRLIGLATAAKKECVEKKQFAAFHVDRLPNHLENWQVSIKLECRYLLLILLPFGTFISQEVFKYVLA
jgi:hypothetical protein